MPAPITSRNRKHVSDDEAFLVLLCLLMLPVVVVGEVASALFGPWWGLLGALAVPTAGFAVVLGGAACEGRATRAPPTRLPRARVRRSRGPGRC